MWNQGNLKILYAISAWFFVASHFMSILVKSGLSNKCWKHLPFISGSATMPSSWFIKDINKLWPFCSHKLNSKSNLPFINKVHQLPHFINHVYVWIPQLRFHIYFKVAFVATSMLTFSLATQLKPLYWGNPPPMLPVVYPGKEMMLFPVSIPSHLIKTRNFR